MGYFSKEDMKMKDGECLKNYEWFQEDLGGGGVNIIKICVKFSKSNKIHKNFEYKTYTLTI